MSGINGEHTMHLISETLLTYLWSVNLTTHELISYNIYAAFAKLNLSNSRDPLWPHIVSQCKNK